MDHSNPTASNPVASSQLAVTHEQLFHYTTVESLRGIVENKSFWATHYSHLNDYSEVELFRPYMTELIAKRLPPFMRRARNKRLSLQRFIQRMGSIESAAHGLAEQSLSHFYEGV